MRGLHRPYAARTRAPPCADRMLDPAPMRRPGLLVFLPLLLALGACAPITYERDADREVGEILRTRNASTLGGRESSVAYPEERVEAEVAAAAQGPHDV